jgi:hypothetical protein
MSTQKEFKVVGVSFNNGAYKVRYANSASRAKVLAQNGHTDILLIELDDAGKKMDCMHSLLDYMDSPECAMNEGMREAVINEARELGFVIQETEDA